MTDKIDNGGPTLPIAEAHYESKGLVLRDYFAAAALQGCLAYSYCNPATGNYHENCSIEGVAEQAYRYADAMIAARKVKP